MKIRLVYQTLEDRNNPEKIIKDGPFPCLRANAWLGEGFYFWESFIQNAHWWGKECNSYKNGYIICEAKFTFDDNLCLNLIDNPDHINLFVKAKELMKAKGLIKSNTTVSRVISFLKSNIQTFSYEASRAYGVNSKSPNSKYSSTMQFKVYGNQYLDLIPPIQICFYKKNGLSLREYKIIYPDKYLEDIVV